MNDCEVLFWGVGYGEAMEKCVAIIQVRWSKKPSHTSHSLIMTSYTHIVVAGWFDILWIAGYKSMGQPRKWSQALGMSMKRHTDEHLQDVLYPVTSAGSILITSHPREKTINSFNHCLKMHKEGSAWKQRDSFSSGVCRRCGARKSDRNRWRTIRRNKKKSSPLASAAMGLAEYGGNTASISSFSSAEMCC